MTPRPIRVGDVGLLAAWAVLHANEPSLALGGVLFGAGMYVMGMNTIWFWRSR